jgi:hypothetical protein
VTKQDPIKKGPMIDSARRVSRFSGSVPASLDSGHPLTISAEGKSYVLPPVNTPRRFHAFCDKAVFGCTVKWFALFADCLTLASVPLALFHEAHLGRAMKRLTILADRLAFARLRHSGADEKGAKHNTKNYALHS